MPNRMSKITFTKLIKALIEDNIKKQQTIHDRDIIIQNLSRKLKERYN